MNKTLKFEIVTGINKGYFHANEQTTNLALVGELWQRLANKIYEESGIYVSAIIRESKAVYNEEWGCPIGGEDTVILTGVANQEFVDDIEKWKDTVIKLAKELKNRLKQSTLTCEFMDTELHYFKE
ncbi:MAG TPA: hypothetical protein DCL31_00285 [Clostridium sp.]|nr:hypothetical protein [Clostridium sp.]